MVSLSPKERLNIYTKCVRKVWRWQRNNQKP